MREKYVTYLNTKAYSEILQLAASNDLIQESLIKRRDLPPHVIEKLLSQASDEISSKLAARNGIALTLAGVLSERTHERAVVDFLSDDWSVQDLAQLTQTMAVKGRLTSSVIVRAAACGHMQFVNHALAVRAGLSPAKAALMVHEPGEFGLKVLVKQAAIAPFDVHMLRGAIAIFHDLEISGVEYDQNHFQRLMIERCLTLPLKLTDADGDYLLEKLDGLAGSDFN